jgi:hypothetical protein
MLDWTGMAYTLSPDLRVTFVHTELDSAAGAEIRIDNGKRLSTISDEGAASLAADTPSGAVAAESTSNNGLVNGQSSSALHGDEAHQNLARTFAAAFGTITLFGFGSGTVTFTLPYELEVQAWGDSADDYGSGIATADLFVSLCCGASAPDDRASESVTWAGSGPMDGEVFSKSGVLELTFPVRLSPMFDATLFFVSARITTETRAAVPEPATVGLLFLGATVITFSRRGIRRRAL